MLGVPAATSLALATLFVAGMLLAVGLGAVLRHSWPASVEARVVVVAMVALVISVPYLGWRVVEDVRYTTRLDPYERRAAGPIQAFLPGYLVDGGRAIVPRGDTYATVVSPNAPNAVARKAFPSLVMVALFPRHSASQPAAQWIVAWGVPRPSLVELGRIYLVHAALGPLPPVLAVRVRR